MFANLPLPSAGGYHRSTMSNQSRRSHRGLPIHHNNDRWFSLSIAVFGGIFLFRVLIIAPALTPIPPGNWPPPELVAEAESAQHFLAIILAINLFFSVSAFVSAIGIFLRKNWAVWLWIGTCVALFLTISVEILTLSSDWSEYLAEYLLVLASLCFYRHRIGLGGKNAR